MTQLFVNAIVLGLMAHMVGDYVIQNDWMALEKTKRWFPAIVHGVTYGLAFIPLLFVFHASVWAWLVIVGTHIVLDHTYAVKHLIWARNQLAPKDYRPGHTATGFNEGRPDWLAVWLMIIVDNLTHITINTLSLVYL